MALEDADEGQEPDAISYASMTDAYASEGKAAAAERWLSQMLVVGLEPKMMDAARQRMH